jgi:hypothetical protein
LQEFLHRAKTLERCISQYVQPSKIPNLREGAATDANLKALKNMLDALRYAIEIYFYRRTYDVNTTWLQDKVVKVRDSLLLCESADYGSGFSGCVGFLWSSFIASCEAEDPEVQISFSKWYKNAARRTGMHCWLNSLNLSEQIWNEKRRSKGSKVTWIDILKRNRLERLQTVAVAG